MNPSRAITMVTLAVAVSVCVLALLGIVPVALDHGRCLTSHGVAHHVDAHFEYECLPAMDFDGDLTLACSNDWKAAQDWVDTICDEWEFPNGRAEADAK